jgi:polysaccharide export outer membrane protein
LKRRSSCLGHLRIGISCFGFPVNPGQGPIHMSRTFEDKRPRFSCGRKTASGLCRFSLAILSVSFFASCSSSTAVKGIPVNDPVLVKEYRTAKEARIEPKRETLAKMSSVKENDTFTEVDGIPEYRVGPLDVLEINSHVGDKVTTTTVTVDNRGRISYSFVDKLEVVGMTPTQIDELLAKKLSSYIRNPRVNTLVKEFRSKNVTVMGELSSLRASTFGKAASGRLNLQGKTNLMDLIALAGGYTVNADIKNLKLIRRGESYLINVYDIIEKADEIQNVIIEDRDVINIPELPAFGERVYVMGEVNAQGVYALKDAQDLLAAISLAGSFTRLAKEENTLIVRGYDPNKKPLVMMADLNALLRKADLSQNIRLENGDLVYVPRMLIGDINDWIANTTPLLTFLLYPYEFESRYLENPYLRFQGRKPR